MGLNMRKIPVHSLVDEDQCYELVEDIHELDETDNRDMMELAALTTSLGLTEFNEVDTAGLFEDLAALKDSRKNLYNINFEDARKIDGAYFMLSQPGIPSITLETSHT
ncbi:hypothetical protein VNI00_013979 [Paramarasmius palmivorus]|uniref:Tropomodulin n=1 Tax=Paramarasmius palmivorus TaxID=297713 RepID=A0AAW0C051_9AGAR